MYRKNFYSNDPRWIAARYASKCRCGTEIRKGETAFYYPSTRTILAKPCGCAETAERDFHSHAADDDCY